MGLFKLATLALAGLATAELPPIHIKGQKFFYENGTQFYMKGIAYQQEVGEKGGGVTGNNYIDPLSDEKICKRDVKLLKELGVNTIRTYAIDPKADHKPCMKLLDEAGIYVVSDLSQPKMSVVRDDPKWTTEHYKRYTDVVDELAQFSNVIGFFAGNEVSDADNNTEASAYVKAALRDTKAHIKDNVKRKELSVGYATNDHKEIRDDIADYFNCGRDSDATDFWGYNIYSWCSPSSMKDSGYADWVEYYKDYHVPVFFAEYGCNTGKNGAEDRDWKDTDALFSKEMTGVFSGGLVYMFHQEDNDYGVVEIKGNEAKKMKNFAPLAKAHANADPETVQEDDYDGKTERRKCPSVGKVWKANTVLPPTPDEELCKCAVAASSCRVKDKTDSEDYGKMFGFICENDKDSCAAINGNGTTGIYGAYSMCDSKSQLSILLGLYADAQDSASDACDFDGKAETKTSNADSSCSDKLDKANEFNKKVASASGPMSPRPTGEETGDSAGGEGEDEDESFGITSTHIARLFSLGDYAVGAYMVVALGVGATMAL